MSVQLIVYPQNYQGFSNSNNPSVEMVANPTDFTNAMTTLTDYSATTTIAQVAVNDIASTMAPNAWYGYVNTSTSALIAATNNMLLLAPPDVGVLQKLTNLTVGSVYNVTLTFASSNPNPVDVKIFNGTTFVSSVIATPSALTATVQFTAQSVNNTIFCLDGISLAVSITSVSIISAGSSPSGAIQLLGDGQVICDLYEDEDLPLTLSVDDFKNVAEQVQSYSKAFNLPATKRNNRIFDQVFEVTRANDGYIFNVYKKTKCVLKQDGFILFDGFLRLLDVTDKLGEISYNVNLYSETIALADTLKDRAFRDLDFTELEHDYNLTNIQLSWSDVTGVAYTNAGTSGYRGIDSIKYPFVDWNHQYVVGASGNPVLPNLETAFRPFINIKYIIDRIFQATPFTYSSTLFNTTDFKKLYMDFNWGSDNLSSSPSQGAYTATTAPFIYSTTTYTNFILDDLNFTSDLNYDNINHRFVALNNNTQYNLDINLVSAYMSGVTGMDFRLVHKDSSGAILNTFYTYFNQTSSFPEYILSQSVLLQQNDTLQVQWKSDVASNYIQYPAIGNHIIATTGGLLATTNSMLQTLRGETGQWDFLKGLITMFNLVTLPDEDNPNNIKIETYSDVFINNADSVQHDWTSKIDISEMKLTPLTDLNKNTIFKFVEDDDDYTFNNYKNLVGGHLYGSKKYIATNEFNILEGTEEIIAEPFAATVVKPLMSQYPDFITPAIYSMNEDGTSEGFENSPRIMYNNGSKTLGSNTYSIPAQNGVVGNAFTSSFLQFSHLTDIPTIVTIPPASTDTRDFNFGECQLLPGVGVPTTKNLFNLYWLPYYSELYNPDTRTMTIKVNLNAADINTFKFNDTVFIKNRVFRVNKIDYKPNDLATVEFILIP